MSSRKAVRRVPIWLIALFAILVIGVLLAWRYFQLLVAPKPLDVSYKTVQTLMPEEVRCIGDSQDGPGVAKEILNLESDDIYIAAGSNPMPDDIWQDFNFRLPLLKNSTRNLLFNGSCFFRSPDVATDCSGDSCFSTEEIAGYTWLKLTTVAGNVCYPDSVGCSGDTVNPGYVSINTIAKCHRIIFDGPVIYELSDDVGNRYVMHATATGIADVNGPVLPEGWMLAERTISEPLVLLPFGGGDQCYYNVVRDNLVQSYHQYVYADSTYP